MKRREFIQHALQQATLLAISSSLLASCKREASPIHKPVIVIGAGIAGLAAAKLLKESGFTHVTVLEAQEKVGGRTRTDRSLGIAFDEGASWIHGIKRNPVTDLAQKAGMTTFATDDASILSYDLGGAARSGNEYTTAEEAFYDILGTLMKSGAADQSFEAVFSANYPAHFNDRLWKFFLSTYITFDTGDLNALSSLLYDEGKEYGGEEVISTNGYDTIATYLAKDLDIQLNQRVSSVEYSGTTVKVTHNGTVSEAEYVVVTVPLGVLKHSQIAFSPALPAAKQTAIEKIGMSCVNKFLLTWDTAFWDDVQYLSYTPEEMDKFNYFVNVKKFHPSVNALMTFAYADYARQTETMTDAEVTEAIMAHLRDMYGSGIPSPTRLLRTRWGSNENSFGAYSFTAVGTEMHHFDDLAATVDSKLFFAGEHTEIDYFSTVHGAWLSGIREAEKIIDLQ